jgi:hypothetical protein
MKGEKMKTVLIVALSVCVAIFAIGCFPQKQEKIEHHERFITLTGVIKDVKTQNGIELPLVTIFTVQVQPIKDGNPYDVERYVALCGDRTDEIVAGAKIDLTYDDMWSLAKGWSTIRHTFRGDAGYRQEVHRSYHTVTQYKILEPAPPPPKTSVEAPPKSAPEETQ